MPQYPTWLAGQTARASTLMAMEPWWAWKAAATSRASTTTISIDPDLQIALPGAGTYQLDAWINYTGGTLGSSDLKVAVEYSGAFSFGVWGVNGINTAGTTSVTVNGQAIGSNTLTLGTSGSTFYTIDIRGHLVATGAGTLGIFWAQGTSSATSTNLRQGCWVKATQVA